MSILAWSMMGIAIWHFAVFVPDRFLGGIVGAFFAAWLGAVAVAFVLNGFDAPGKDDTDLIQAFLAIPGAVAGLGLFYWLGVRAEGNPEA
ncbi:MAG: hypothetical protein HZB14_02185 [Actinobacteria bacterium]|nr:hypothetical protein [Actinomycetota bacterium]